MKSSPAVYVEWVDSHANPSRVWKTRDDLPTEAGKIVTIGFIALENDKVLVLAGSHHAGGNAFAGEMAIPKVSITKRKRVTFA